MNFTINPEKNTIKAQGIKFLINIPQDQREFWLELQKEARGSVYNQDTPISHLWYEPGKICFGQYTAELINEDGQVEQVPEFKTAFYFCLATYTLKSLTGIPIRPQIITHDLKELKIPSNDAWLYNFYSLWKDLAYTDGNHRTKAQYMFMLNNSDIEILKCAEKLYRAGFMLGPKVMNSLLRSSSCTADSQLLPHQILKLQKCVFDVICSNLEAFENLSSYQLTSRLNALRAFPDYGEVWSIVKDLGIAPSFIRLITEEDARERLQDLVEHKAYDRKRLLEYIFIDVPQKQGFCDFQRIVSELQDYASMSDVALGSVENKYPKYLKTEHDIMVSKFNKIKIALEETDVIKYYDKHKWNWCSSYFKDTYFDKHSAPYRIVAPTSTADIVEEGKKMHHCVANYIPRIKNGASLILFMRSNNPARSWNTRDADTIRHLTIELRDNKIVQARGLFNRDPNEAELRCLKEYCEAKDLEISGYLVDLYKSVVGYDVSEPFDKGLKKENRKDEVLC